MYCVYATFFSAPLLRIFLAIEWIIIVCGWPYLCSMVYECMYKNVTYIRIIRIISSLHTHTQLNNRINNTQSYKTCNSSYIYIYILLYYIILSYGNWRLYLIYICKIYKSVFMYISSWQEELVIRKSFIEFLLCNIHILHYITLHIDLTYYNTDEATAF